MVTQFPKVTSYVALALSNQSFINNKYLQLIASLWSITREEEYHDNADTFDPDRYFDGKNERTPYYVFGYGHRSARTSD